MSLGGGAQDEASTPRSPTREPGALSSSWQPATTRSRPGQLSSRGPTRHRRHRTRPQRHLSRRDGRSGRRRAAVRHGRGGLHHVVLRRRTGGASDGAGRRNHLDLPRRPLRNHGRNVDGVPRRDGRGGASPRDSPLLSPPRNQARSDAIVDLILKAAKTLGFPACGRSRSSFDISSRRVSLRVWPVSFFAITVLMLGPPRCRAHPRGAGSVRSRRLGPQCCSSTCPSTRFQS